MTYPYSVEPPTERSPMLDRHESNSKTMRTSSSPVFRVLHFFGGGIYAPDASTYDPIEILLNTEDEEERDELTERWKNNRLSELSFVGVVAALLAGVLTSTGSWPDILPNGQQSHWPVRTSWYCGIILSLFSILTAADQTVRLHRLSSHRDAFKNIRKLLAKTKGRRRVSEQTGRIQPNYAQIYTWQLPVIFLTSATLCMIVGMFLHVWSATMTLDKESWWGPDSKVALTFTIVAVVSIAIFFAGQTTLYAPDLDDGDD